MLNVRLINNLLEYNDLEEGDGYAQLLAVKIAQGFQEKHEQIPGVNALNVIFAAQWYEKADMPVTADDLLKGKPIPSRMRNFPENLKTIDTAVDDMIERAHGRDDPGALVEALGMVIYNKDEQKEDNDVYKQRLKRVVGELQDKEMLE